MKLKCEHCNKIRALAANPIPQCQSVEEFLQMMRSQSLRAAFELFIFSHLGGHPETHKPVSHFVGFVLFLVTSLNYPRQNEAQVFEFV